MNGITLMKKRIFAILLAAMLTAPMVVSCAGDTAEETTAENSAGGENAAVETETEPGWQYPDVDYQGGYRGSERIVYSADGYVYYTEDHYQSFEQLYP